jgi:hypothetical protein
VVAYSGERDPQDARSGRVGPADVEDRRSDAAEAPRFDLALRGLSTLVCDEQILTLTSPSFDGAHEFFSRQVTHGREAA